MVDLMRPVRGFHLSSSAMRWIYGTALAAEHHELLTLFNTFNKLTLEVCSDLCSSK